MEGVRCVFRDAGGAFGKMEAAHEEMYFRKQVCFLLAMKYGLRQSY